MHDHTWDCVSIVLDVGYFKVTPEGRCWCPPGEIIFWRADEPHRIEIIPARARSLFIRGMMRREHGYHTAARWVRAGQETMRLARAVAEASAPEGAGGIETGSNRPIYWPWLTISRRPPC